MTAAQQAADDMIARYIAAVWEKDADALLALYAADARVFDLFDHWSYQGRDAWRGAIDAWFGSMGSERVRVEFDDVRTVGSDDVAAVSALITYREVDTTGTTTNAMPNRLSWNLQRSGETWLIVHEHTSVPINGETFKGTFER